jgi:hypothetical protein
MFIEVNDGSSIANLQVVADSSWADKYVNIPAAQRLRFFSTFFQWHFCDQHWDFSHIL